MQRLAADVGRGAAVDPVAHDRPAARGEVHANLVRPSGDELTPKQGHAAHGAEHLVASHALATSILYRDTPAIPRIAAERKGDRPCALSRASSNHSQIFLPDVAVC